MRGTALQIQESAEKDGKKMFQMPELRFPCRLWRSVGVQRSTCSPQRSPILDRRGGLQPTVRHIERGSLKTLKDCILWYSNSCCYSLGRTAAHGIHSHGSSR